MTSLEMGDYVQTRRARFHYLSIPAGTRGTVRSLDEDWATVELPTGGRFHAHIENLTPIVRGRDIKREESLG